MRDYSRYFLEDSFVEVAKGSKNYVMVLSSDNLIVKNVNFTYEGEVNGISETRLLLMALMTELANRIDRLDLAGKLP